MVGVGIGSQIIIIIILYIIPWLVDVLSSEFPARLALKSFPDFPILADSYYFTSRIFPRSSQCIPRWFSLPIKIFIDTSRNFPRFLGIGIGIGNRIGIGIGIGIGTV